MEEHLYQVVDLVVVLLMVSKPGEEVYELTELTIPITFTAWLLQVVLMYQPKFFQAIPSSMAAGSYLTIFFQLIINPTS